jgi:GNAT superfamily N-acetyltransferase
VNFSDTSSEFTLARLNVRDVEQCLALSSAAGWNQTHLDWQFHLRYGEGIGFKTDRGVLVATGVILPAHEEAAWIAMVLVGEDYRRRGLGRKVMEILISESSVPCLALDATDLGLSLYEGLGFRALERIIRHRLTREGDPNRPYSSGRKAANNPFNGISRALADRADVSVLREGTAWGSVRPGRTARHIGPVTAGSEADAAALVRAVLDDTEGDVLIDIPVRLGTFSRRVERLGFSPRRVFVRMARRGSLLVDPGIFAIAGPEYG